VTLAPRGRTVILDRDFGARQIVNSGVPASAKLRPWVGQARLGEQEEHRCNRCPNTVEAISECLVGICKVREAASETVLKEQTIRVEDALLAARAAIEGRVVPGDVEATMPNLGTPTG
jgi:hypothetical protein